MKTYYDLLSVGPGAPADEIKRAFRREIARYHPDKVQHLGPEFQEIAATRAAELTEAYRVLMDPGARELYDAGVRGMSAEPPVPAAGPAVQPPGPPQARTDRAAPPVPETVRQTRASVSEFVKRAAVARLKTALDGATGGAVTVPAAGFDAAYEIKAKGGLFKKGDPPVHLLARLVPQVDAAAVQESWPMALKSAISGATVCLVLLGSGVASAGELSNAVADLRRKSRTAGPVLVPVDFRDWDALFPPETPAVVRTVVQRLKQER